MRAHCASLARLHPCTIRRAIHLGEILSALRISQIANSSCILNKSTRNLSLCCMFLLLCPSLYRSALPRCTVWFGPKKKSSPKTKEKRRKKISAKLTDELKRKMFILCILLSPSSSSIEIVSFFIIIYLKCQYGSASESCKSSTPKVVGLRYMRS